MSFFVASRRWRGVDDGAPPRRHRRGRRPHNFSQKRTQVPEEDSLYASLYAVHRTTPQIIDAIEAGRDAMRLDDARALSEALTAFKQALRATAEAHHFDREASRGERVVMRRLRHFPAAGGRHGQRPRGGVVQRF